MSENKAFDRIYKSLKSEEEIPEDLAKIFEDELSKQHKDISSIQVHTDLAHIKDSDIVVIATDSDDATLVTPSMVKDGAIVCCTSVPTNLSSEFKPQPNGIIAFDGGLSKLPEDSEINFVGMPKNGITFGCLAETLLLGFDGYNHSFCKGVLTTDNVYATLEMAEIHGFSLGTLKLDDQVVIT